MNAKSKTAKIIQFVRPEQTETERLHEARRIQWIKEQVAVTGNIRDCTRGLRMSEEEIQAVLDANP
jgi:hypothetical protein